MRRAREPLDHALSIHMMHYNFMRIHHTVRVTRAMEAGVETTPWTWSEWWHCWMGSSYASPTLDGPADYSSRDTAAMIAATAPRPSAKAAK